MKTYEDHFALIPHKCNQCGRIFWLEEYRVYFKQFGVGSKVVKEVYCKDCYLDKKYKFARIKIGI